MSPGRARPRGLREGAGGLSHESTKRRHLAVWGLNSGSRLWLPGAWLLRADSSGTRPVLLRGPCCPPHVTSASPRTSGDLPASAKGQGPELIVYSVDRLVNTTFICSVSNALGEGRAEQLVLVRGEPAWGAALGEAVPPAGRAGRGGFSLSPQVGSGLGDRVGVGRGVGELPGRWGPGRVSGKRRRDAAPGSSQGDAPTDPHNECRGAHVGWSETTASTNS